MKIVQLISVIAFAALAAGPLHAQDKAASTPAPAADKQIAEDCAKEHGKHHDHAAEKGTAGGMKSKCMNEKAGAKKGAKKPLHDHNKEHKS